MKIRIFSMGYYIDKKGIKRWGIVKHDGRKRQTVYIVDVDTGKKVKIEERLNKKEMKILKKEAKNIISKKRKTFRGKKVIQIEPKLKVKKLEIIDIEPYGGYTRKSCFVEAKNPEDVRDYIYSMLRDGIEKLKADYCYISVRVKGYVANARYNPEINVFMYAQDFALHTFEEMQISLATTTYEEFMNKLRNFYKLWLETKVIIEKYLIYCVYKFEMS